MTTGRINQVAADTGPIDARGPRPGRTGPASRERGRAAVAGPRRVAVFRTSANNQCFASPAEVRKLFGTTAPRRHAREGARSPARPGGGPQLHQYS